MLQVWVSKGYLQSQPIKNCSMTSNQPGHVKGAHPLHSVQPGELHHVLGALKQSDILQADEGCNDKIKLAKSEQNLVKSVEKFLLGSLITVQWSQPSVYISYVEKQGGLRCTLHHL